VERDGGILITEKGEQHGRGNFFDSVCRSRRAIRKTSSRRVGNSTSFKFVSETDGLASTNAPIGSTPLRMASRWRSTEAGRWTFNRKLGMSESLTSSKTLRIKLNNVEVAIPVEIKYERVPPKLWAKLESDRLARETRCAEWRSNRLPEAKAAAEAPIVGDERTRVLAALRSTDAARWPKPWPNLSKKSPRDDAELAQAIQPLLTHSDTKVPGFWAGCFGAFSPAYNVSTILIARTRGSYEVKRSRPCGSLTTRSARWIDRRRQ